MRRRRPMFSARFVPLLAIAVSLSGLSSCKDAPEPPRKAPPNAGSSPTPSTVVPTPEPAPPSTGAPPETDLTPNVEPAPAPTLATPRAATIRTPSSLLARAGDYGLLRLVVRGFDRLPPKQRVLAYHLSRAALAGRDITWDQRHRLALDLRTELEQVIQHGAGLPQDLRRRLRESARELWIANGPYHERSGLKRPMRFSKAEWTSARARAIAAGAKLGPVDTALEALMFDPTVDPRLIGRNGADPVAGSGANFYENITADDLLGFKDAHPLNSRLTKDGDRLIEEVYRTGRVARAGVRPAPRGRYARPLTAVVEALRLALSGATDQQANQLRHLVDYFETGDAGAFERSNISWLTLIGAPVDAILGFIETDDDARGMKGTWEGLVTVDDPAMRALIEGIKSEASYFERAMPWADAYKREAPTLPDYEARQVVAAHGDAGPSIPLGISLPNADHLRREYGQRTVWFTNVIRAIDEATESLLVDEFAPPDERAPARKYAAIISDLKLVLHEILGKGAGRLSERLKDSSPDLYLKELSTAVDEARAELVALHFLWDPKVRALRPDCPDACAEAALRAVVRRDLTMLRHVPGDRLEDDHLRAAHLIVQFASARGAIETQRSGGRTYLVLKDVAAMKLAVKDLLVEVMRIRAEGDYKAARALFEAHGLFFDKALRDEVKARAKALKLPTFYAFVMPELRPRPATGPPIDATLSYTDDFDAQHLGWSNALR